MSQGDCRPVKEDFTIRNVLANDAEAIVAIYNHYVTRTRVTFEETAVSLSEMERRIAESRAAELPWLVAERKHTLVGYAYLKRWRPRHAYRFSCESTIYVAPALGQQGIGSALYRDLLDAAQARGIHSVIGGIALPNEPSVRLHEKLGFEKAAHFKQVGFKFDRWIDVGYWQKRL